MHTPEQTKALEDARAILAQHFDHHALVAIDDGTPEPQISLFGNPVPLMGGVEVLRSLILFEGRN